ncbi:Actin, gamma [Histomonas meleagridis]|uniref:Actin, gamma n=1 Tax=Histomonas meleagridis TaxID=135588 RepID=UPI00355A82D3|nr:Actin, gamma [Histomonas meleagridis]KAH0803851.1 Actin, gamma [Histomonas meleagridis]
MEISTIVIDNGSYLIRAGLSGEPEPAVSVPPYIGSKRKHKSEEINYYIGHDALRRKNTKSVTCPIENRTIVDYESIEQIWKEIIQNKLKLKPEEHPVLITESPYATKISRERSIEIMMEKFQVPSYYSTFPEILSLYHSGQTTGLVIDAGLTSVNILPIFECYAMTHILSKLDIGGFHINEALKKLLSQSDITLQKSSESKILRDIKEKYCYVALDVDAEMQKAEYLNEFAIKYPISNDNEIALSTQRFKCTEPLFDPPMVQVQQPGLPILVNETLDKCGDLRAHFCSNILLAGGTSMLPGLSERLKKDVSKLAETNLRIMAPKNRDISAWIGGSVLASLATFSQMWITKEEYDETGNSIVHLKCF